MVGLGGAQSIAKMYPWPGPGFGVLSLGQKPGPHQLAESPIGRQAHLPQQQPPSKTPSLTRVVSLDTQTRKFQWPADLPTRARGNLCRMLSVEPRP